MTCMRGSLVIAVLALACDPRAKAGDSSRSGSKEYESCSSSAQCENELRCFDHTCRRTTRSAVGDYFAALGAQLRKAGDLEGSIDAYSRAVGNYESEKIAVPPDVDCAYGSALVAAKGKKDHAELGARVLHNKCILAVPVGSRLREVALADLATLSDAGLDPLVLGRTAAADVYLTRAPSAPSTDKLAVTVTPSPAVTGKTYQNIPDKLNEADVKTALVSCWQQYNDKTHKDAMTVTIGVKSTYTPSEYEDEAGSFAMKIDPPGPLAPGSPEAAADQCVRAIVEPALKSLTTVRDAFTTKLAIAIK